MLTFADVPAQVLAALRATTALEWLAVGTGFACVWLAARESRWNFPVAIVSCGLYVATYHQSRLYSDRNLQGFFIALSLYGWHEWLYGGRGHAPLSVSRTPAREWLRCTLFAAAYTAGFGYYLQHHTDAALPYLDSLTTGLSLVAQFLELFPGWCTLPLYREAPASPRGGCPRASGKSTLAAHFSTGFVPEHVRQYRSTARPTPCPTSKTSPTAGWSPKMRQPHSRSACSATAFCPARAAVGGPVGPAVPLQLLPPAGCCTPASHLPAPYSAPNPPLAMSAVSIYAEASPNPESMKFVLNSNLLVDGVSVDYPTLEAAANSPLAQELFGFDYVGRVFIAQNFVTVTKTQPDMTWTQLIPELRQFLKSYIEAGGPLFLVDPAAEQKAAQAASAGDPTQQDGQIAQKVIDLLDNYVRPAVEQDGGNITFKSYHEGVVTVNLQGSCSGCPSATVTLKSGIENLLKRMVPEVQSVVAEGILV